LAALLDRSLLHSAEGADGETRFTMLETIREYALEQLVAWDELEAMRRRHALHYIALAHAAEPEMWGAQRKRWMDRLEQEYANLRAVLDWAGARGEIELGLQLGSALWHIWDAQGMVTEGRAHLSALLAQAQTGPPTPAHIKALRGAGLIACDQGDVSAAHALFD
jgi:predicted ATPase